MSINITNTNFPFLYNQQIVEWDIKSANTSLMRYYNIASESVIDRFEKMKKSERERAVGLFSLKHKDFAMTLENKFTDIINQFIKINNIKEDNIISIKKDAIFVKNKDIKVSSFDQIVNFIPKNTYTGFLKIPRYEFYYNKNKIDIKGLNNNNIPLHINGILLFIKAVFEEASNYSEINKFLKEYSYAYKNKELTIDSYREFNSDSSFKTNIMGTVAYFKDADESLLRYIDISFNYINVYMPALQTILF